MLMLVLTMHQRMQLARLRPERGGNLVEYALLMALIALVCFAAVTTLGTTVGSKFEPIGSSLAG